jgi:hypothetical protein
MPAHLLDDLCASRVQLPLQQINRAHDLTVRRKTFDGRYLPVGNMEAWRLTRKFEGLNFSFCCVVCFRRTGGALSLPRPLSISSQKEPWIHPLGFTLIRRLLDGKANRSSTTLRRKKSHLGARHMTATSTGAISK